MKAKRPKTFHNGQGATWTAVFTGLPKAMPQGEKNKNPLVGVLLVAYFPTLRKQINPHRCKRLKRIQKESSIFRKFQDHIPLTRIYRYRMDSAHKKWCTSKSHQKRPVLYIHHSYIECMICRLQYVFITNYIFAFNCTNTHRKERLIFQESFHWLSAAGMKSFCLKNHAKLSTPPEWMPWRLFLRLERCFSRPRWDFLQTTNCQTVGSRSCDHEALRSHDHRRRDLLLIPRPFLQGHLLPTTKQIACPVTTWSKVPIW